MVAVHVPVWVTKLPLCVALLPTGVLLLQHLPLMLVRAFRQLAGDLAHLGMHLHPPHPPTPVFVILALEFVIYFLLAVFLDHVLADENGARGVSQARGSRAVACTCWPRKMAQDEIKHVISESCT